MVDVYNLSHDLGEFSTAIYNPFTATGATATRTAFGGNQIPANLINPGRASRFIGDPQTDWGKVMNGYNYIEALNGTGAFSGNIPGTTTAIQPPLTLASRYGLPQTFQIARQFRFAVRFMF